MQVVLNVDKVCVKFISLFHYERSRLGSCKHKTWIEPRTNTSKVIFNGNRKDMDVNTVLANFEADLRDVLKLRKPPEPWDSFVQGTVVSFDIPYQ
jgi:hypothetical protein